MAVHSSDINFVWVHLLHLLLQVTLRAKRLVPDIDVIFEGEGEFTVLEVPLGHCQSRRNALSSHTSLTTL